MAGIQTEYVDGFGERHAAPPETIKAIEDAVRGQAGVPRESAHQTLVVTARQKVHTGPAEILLEDGSARTIDRVLPQDLPLGYHQISRRGARPERDASGCGVPGRVGDR